MPRRAPFRPPAVAVALALGVVLLTACTGSAVRHPGPRAPATTTPRAAAPASAAPPGSPGNPVVLTCGQESFLDPPTWQPAGPGDLTAGPLIMYGGRAIASGYPAVYGVPNSYKLPVAVPEGTTATLAVAGPAVGKVVIENPYAPARGVTAITYRPCANAPGAFPQSLKFTDGRTRGCVPLIVTYGRPARVAHLTVSLDAGRCG